MLEELSEKLERALKKLLVRGESPNLIFRILYGKSDVFF
jgi:hypothetical protein